MNEETEEKNGLHTVSIAEARRYYADSLLGRVNPISREDVEVPRPLAIHVPAGARFADKTPIEAILLSPIMCEMIGGATPMAARFQGSASSDLLPFLIVFLPASNEVAERKFTKLIQNVAKYPPTLRDNFMGWSYTAQTWGSTAYFL